MKNLSSKDFGKLRGVHTDWADVELNREWNRKEKSNSQRTKYREPIAGYDTARRSNTSLKEWIQHGEHQIYHLFSREQAVKHLWFGGGLDYDPYHPEKIHQSLLDRIVEVGRKYLPDDFNGCDISDEADIVSRIGAFQGEPELASFLGRSAMRTRHYEIAVQFLSISTRHKDGDAGILAVALHNTGQTENALALVNHQIELQPDAVSLYAYRGTIRRDIDPAGALKDFETAFDSGYRHRHFLDEYLKLARGLEMDTLAKRIIEEFIEKYGDRKGRLYADRARLHARSGDFDKAHNDYEQSRNVKAAFRSEKGRPDDIDVRIARALGQGNEDPHLGDYAAALNHAQRNNKGLNFQLMQRLQEQIRTNPALQQRALNETEVIVGIIQILLRSKSKMSIDIAKRLLHHANHDELEVQMLALSIYNRLSNPDKFMEWKAKIIQETPLVHYQTGKFYFLQNQPDEAALYFEKSMNLAAREGFNHFNFLKAADMYCMIVFAYGRDSVTNSRHVKEMLVQAASQHDYYEGAVAIMNWAASREVPLVVHSERGTQMVCALYLHLRMHQRHGFLPFALNPPDLSETYDNLFERIVLESLIEERQPDPIVARTGRFLTSQFDHRIVTLLAEGIRGHQQHIPYLRVILEYATKGNLISSEEASTILESALIQPDVLVDQTQDTPTGAISSIYEAMLTWDIYPVDRVAYRVGLNKLSGIDFLESFY